MSAPREADPARLADVVDGHAERFVPELMGGMLIDAEHRGRYWWAAALVVNERVLDAGCGTGYGANILALAGASEVVGIDRAAHVIAAARQHTQPGVTFEVADLLELPFPDNDFGVVACFEAIEHVEAPDTALDEVARVLRPDGVLAISSPNRSVYVKGNPHHRHEYFPEELESALRRRFKCVRLVRQHDWLAAAIFEDSAFGAGDGMTVDAATVRKLAPAKPGLETYTLALASNVALPTPPAVVVLSQDVEIGRLIEQVTSLSEHATSLSREGEARQLVIEELEATLEAEARSAREAREEVQAIMRTKTFRYMSTVGTVYARLRKLARRG
jgi:2-polyprenyl-3-methyl-5-hydroxy-6-metoxy-1,4-benzoquinol methylase